jgi:hypothetical protein
MEPCKASTRRGSQGTSLTRGHKPNSFPSLQVTLSCWFWNSPGGRSIKARLRSVASRASSRFHTPAAGILPPRATLCRQDPWTDKVALRPNVILENFQQQVVYPGQATTPPERLLRCPEVPCAESAGVEYLPFPPPARLPPGPSSRTPLPDSIPRPRPCFTTTQAPRDTSSSFLDGLPVIVHPRKRPPGYVIWASPARGLGVTPWCIIHIIGGRAKNLGHPFRWWAAASGIVARGLPLLLIILSTWPDIHKALPPFPICL